MSNFDASTSSLCTTLTPDKASRGHLRGRFQARERARELNAEENPEAPGDEDYNITVHNIRRKKWSGMVLLSSGAVPRYSFNVSLEWMMMMMAATIAG